MKTTINKRLLPMKAHYFFFNAGTGPVVPFMPTLARQLGFSSIVVGTMYTILPIIGMLAKPVFCLIADKFQKHKLLFILAQFITAISFLCIMFIPAAAPPSTQVQLICNQGISEISYGPFTALNYKRMEDLNTIDEKLERKFANQTSECHLECHLNAWEWQIVCKNWHIAANYEACQSTNQHHNNDILKLTTLIDLYHNIVLKSLFFRINTGLIEKKNVMLYCPSNVTSELFNATCRMSCSNEEIINIITEGNDIEEINKVTDSYQFWIFFGLLMTSWAGMAIVVSVGDTICFEILGDQRHLYGNQRLWGAVGWGIFSAIAGVLVDKMSDGSFRKDYTIAFIMTFCIILLDMAASSKLETTKTKLSHNIFKDIGKTFLSVPVLIFFMWCIAVGLCTAVIWNFLFWHLESMDTTTQYMKTIQGLAMGIQCFGGELPFFFLSGWILNKIGHVNAMSVVLFGFSVRFFFYSLLTNPWWVLPIELLNGVTFGIFYSTMASYASIVAPPGTEATIQGLTGAIFEGIGVSVGSLTGGILIAQVGAAKTFKIFSIGALCVCCIHIIVQFLLNRCNRQKEGYTMNYHSPTLLLDDQDT